MNQKVNLWVDKKKVVRIFELSGTNRKLFSAQFEGEELDDSGGIQNAFSKVRADWSNPIWFNHFSLSSGEITLIFMVLLSSVGL
jgi:hypothetical protein